MILGEITMFHHFNCIFECGNGFGILENSCGSQNVWTQQLKVTIFSVSVRISGKICLEKGQKVTLLDYCNLIDAVILLFLQFASKSLLILILRGLFPVWRLSPL